MIPYKTIGNPSHPPVVLIHGFMGWPSDWTPVVHAIQAQCQVVLVSLPGHGKVPIESESIPAFESVCQVLKTILDQLEINTAIIVGYSLGGRIAVEFSNRFPQRVRHLIVIGGHFGLSNEADRRERLQHDNRVTQQLLSEPFDQFLTDWYAQPLFSTLKKTTDLPHLIADKIRLHSPQRLATALTRFSLGHQTLFDWHAGSFDIDYVVGSADQKFMAYAQSLGNQPQLSVTTIENSGHALIHEAPDQLASLILSRIELRLAH